MITLREQNKKPVRPSAFISSTLKNIVTYYFVLFFFTAMSAYLETSTRIKPLSFIGDVYAYAASDSCGDLRIAKHSKGISVESLTFTPSNVECLKKEMKGKEWLVISSSPGGSSMSARHFQKYLNDNNMKLHVEYACLSACVEFLSSVNSSSAGEFLYLANHREGLGVPIWASLFLTPIDNVFYWVSTEMLVNSGVPRDEVTRTTSTTELTKVPHEKLIPLGYVNKISKINNFNFDDNSENLDEVTENAKIGGIITVGEMNSLINTSKITLAMFLIIVFSLIIILVFLAKIKRPIE